jgi:chromosome partitioning protein
MTKPTRIFVLRAAGDVGLATRLIERLRTQESVRPEVFDLAKVRALPDSGSAWYVPLLAPELTHQTQSLDWIMETHPDRVLPVLARDCSPETLHPRLAFLIPHDLRGATDKAIDDLRREWQKQGIGRDKAAASLLLFLSLKGGVAKTTNSVAVAEYLAEQGNRVLVIDTDHQCGASAMLLGEDQLEVLEEGRRTLADLFFEALNRDFDPERIEKYTSPCRSIHGLGSRLRVLPGSLRLEDFWSHFRPTDNRDATTSKEGYEFLKAKRKDAFTRWLKVNYDYVLVDCPPAIAWQVRFFLLAGDGYIVPAIPDRLSVRGARYLTRRLRNIGLKNQPIGLLWSIRREIQTHNDYINAIKTGRERMPFERPDVPDLPTPFKTVIPHAVAISRAQTGNEAFKSFHTKYEAAPAKLFSELCREIIARTRCPVPVTVRQPVLAGS